MVSVACALTFALTCPLAASAMSLKAKPGPSPCPDDIPVEMYDRLESVSALPGEVFRFRTLRTVMVNGARFPAGTWGYGLVRAVTPPGRHDAYGTLAIEPRYLVLPHGKQQPVTMDPHLPASFSSARPNLEKVIGRVPMPVPGMAMTAAGYVRYGRDVVLGEGFRFAVVPLFDLSESPACPLE